MRPEWMSEEVGGAGTTSLLRRSLMVSCAVPGGASVAKFTAETLGGGGWPARQVEAALAWADRTDALKGIDWFGVLGWLVLVGCVSFSSPSRYAMADAWDPRFTGWGSGARYR